MHCNAWALVCNTLYAKNWVYTKYCNKQRIIFVLNLYQLFMLGIGLEPHFRESCMFWTLLKVLWQISI